MSQANPGWQWVAAPAPDGDAELEAAAVDAFIAPRCERCGGLLKPDVVFFGGEASVLKQVEFRFPLEVVLGVFFVLIALVLVTAVTWVLKGFENLSTLWALLPAIVLYAQLGWAVATLAGYINVVFRDTQHFCEVAFQILFYLTPIIYPVHAVAETAVGWLVRYNPLVPFLNMVRLPVLDGALPTLRCYAAATAITLIMTALAALTLRYQQRRVILYL